MFEKYRYFGITICVIPQYKYVATDYDGTVKAFINKPSYEDETWSSHGLFKILKRLHRSQMNNINPQYSDAAINSLIQINCEKSGPYDFIDFLDESDIKVFGPFIKTNLLGTELLVPKYCDCMFINGQAELIASNTLAFTFKCGIFSTMPYEKIQELVDIKFNTIPSNPQVESSMSQTKINQSEQVLTNYKFSLKAHAEKWNVNTEKAYYLITLGLQSLKNVNGIKNNFPIMAFASFNNGSNYSDTLYAEWNNTAQQYELKCSVDKPESFKKGNLEMNTAFSSSITPIIEYIEIDGIKFDKEIVLKALADYNGTAK